MLSDIITHNEESNTNSIPQQLKFLTFILFSSANKSRITSKAFGILLMFICFIQISSFFKFHTENEPIDEFQSHYKPISVLMNLSIYLYPDIISINLIDTFLILIYIFIVLLILSISLLMYLSMNSLRYKAIALIVQYTFLIYQWILFIPILQVLIQSTSFNATSSNIPKSILHLVLILLFGIFQCTLCYFNLISSVDNHDFFYIKEATIPFRLFFIQILSLLLGLIAYAFPLFLFIGYLLILLMLITATVISFNNFAFYSKGFMRTYIVLLSLLYERYLNSMINKYTSITLSRPFNTYNIITIVIMAFTYILIEKIFFSQVIDYSLRMDINRIKSPDAFVKFFTSINDLIHSDDSDNHHEELKIKRIGVTMNHLANCTKEDKCLLKSKEELYLPRVQITSKRGVSPYYDQVKSVFMIKELFNKYYQSYQFYFEFCLCYIIFIIYTVGNNELALSEIEMLKRFVSLSLSQEFIMYLLKEHTNECIMNNCEQQMDDSEFDAIKNRKRNRNIGNDGHNDPDNGNGNGNEHGSSNKPISLNLDFGITRSNYSLSATADNNNDLTSPYNKKRTTTWSVLQMLYVINYDRISTNIKNYIYLCLDTKRELWKLFLNEDIIIEDVFQAGKRFFDYKSRIYLLWKEIGIISNDQQDTELTRIYCDFLDKICDDKIESRFILDKTPIFISNTQDELYNNRYKADIGIVIVEINCAYNPGRINYINQPLIGLLGYHKNELIDNNVKVIIPGEIGRYHDELIINYFDKGRSDMLKKTMNTLSLKSKEKYLIPIHLLVGILPNLKKKMEGIALIRPQIKKKVEMIMTNENGVIEALTENMGHLLNITPSLLEKSNIYVQSFFVDLMRPEKDKGDWDVPRFMTDEYFSNNKAIDLKMSISCPQKNSIDKGKLKVRTRNIYINQGNMGNSNVNENDNDHLPNRSNSKLIKNMNMKILKKEKEKEIEDMGLTMNMNINKKSVAIVGDKPESNAQQAQTQLASLSPKSPIVPKAQRSLFTQAYGKVNHYAARLKGENLLHFSPLHDKLTPDMELIIKYRKTFLDLLPKSNDSESNRDSTSQRSPINHRHNTQRSLSPINKPKSNLIEIYNSMLSIHDYHSLTEKTDLILIHLGMKIYNNTIPLRIIMIQSDMLFDEKKIEEEFSFTSEVNIAEKKNDNLIQKDKEEDIDQFFEICSVAHKDTDISLQKHLKKFKNEKTHQFLFHKAIGLLMGLTVIATELAVILLSNHLYDYVMNFNTIIKEVFTLNTLLIDISKYSIINQLERQYEISHNEYRNYNINAVLIKENRAKAILSLLDNYFDLIQSIYGSKDIVNAYNGNGNNNDKVLDFLLTNRRFNMTFINSIYLEVSNALDNQVDSLKAVSVNSITTIRQHFAIIHDLYFNHYIKYTKDQFTLSMLIVTLSLIILITFLIVLLYSYINKRTEQVQLLSAYEKISNEDIENIISSLDQFELKYQDAFKLFDEYTTKKVTFQKENTQFLFKKYQNRLQRDQKEEEEKKLQYNILNQAKEEEEIEEKTKKSLINRQKVTGKYVYSFLLIFSIVFVYSIVFYYEIWYYNTVIIKRTQSIVFNLFHSKFLLNYLSFKLVNVIYNRLHIISSFDVNMENDFKSFINTTHSQYNALSIQLNANSHLFQGNISDIMTGRICAIVTSIDICKDKTKDEKNGMRAITAFYFKSIDDAYLFYSNHYKLIDDLGGVFSNEKYTIVNLLIENLQLVYDEIFAQMTVALEGLFSSAIVDLVVVSIVLGGMFIMGLVYKLISFIDGIKQEECLCKKLIGELPYDVVKWNYDIQKQLTGLIGPRE